MPFARDSQMIVHSEGMLGPICPAASCKPVGKFLHHQLIATLQVGLVRVDDQVPEAIR